MIQAFKNIWSIPELRRRVLFTFGLLGVYRIGGHIPTPGIDSEALRRLFEEQQGSILGFVDLFSGGNFSRLTIFALGIMPYITASIILQLLTVIWPYLEKLSKEGEAGRKKITQWTRYGTVLLSFVQSYGIALWLQSNNSSDVGRIVLNPGFGFQLMTVLTLTTGTAFIMWLGEQISERGIGNGISLIIYAGIVVGLPGAVAGTWIDLTTGQLSPIAVLLLLAVMVLVVAAIVLVERAQRRIPIQYARRVVGRRVYGGASTYLPLRVNTAGVIPVIFASSVLAIPQTIGAQLPRDWGLVQAILRQFEYSAPLYNLLYSALIVFFCFFYVSIIFNPMDQADNMKKYGGFVPGIRPGKRTAEYIDRILTRLTFGGAVYLALISLLPVFLISGFQVQTLPWGIGEALERLLPDFLIQGLGVNFFFGGTSLLIVVGVAMDTVQQVESQLIMRHYEGFMKGTRIRGRRG